MTVYGWDASHHDDTPKTRDRIDFYTHKITDGNRYYRDTGYKAAVDAMRSFGVPILGSYHVLHGQTSLSAQADWWVEQVTQDTPWWQAHPYWVWQVDAEPFDYLTAPTIDQINKFGGLVLDRTGCPAQSFLVYAPAWHYGVKLTELRYPLWHSSYGANPVGWYQDVYPGDNSARWRAPIDPLILQYGSRTTIAGQTTCDADAFRGTLDELKARLKPKTLEDDVTKDDFFAWLTEWAKTQKLGWASNAQRDRMVTANWAAEGLSTSALLAYTFERAGSAATLDANDLAKIAAAVASDSDQLAAAIVAKLPTGQAALTTTDVETAVRAVFADAATTP